MNKPSVTGRATWVRVVLWALALGLAVAGIVLAIVWASFWPLITLAGLAIPMIPVGSARTATSGPRSSRG